MTRQEIIQEIKANNYFSIKELVCKHVFNKFGEKAWQFLDTELLHTMLVIRKTLNNAIIVNNWASGGTLTQRGCRCNLGQSTKEKKTTNTL